MHADAQRRLDQAIAEGVCSAAALSIGDGGREVLRLAVGHTRAVPDRGDAVDERAVFDLASVTKAMSTAAIAAALVGRGALSLDAPARSLVRGGGALDARITIAHLLGHAAGFPAHRKFYDLIWADEWLGATSGRDALLAHAIATPLERAPGEAAVYSDLGYITLGAALEGAGGAPLETLFATHVGEPLGLSARFVDLRTPARPAWPAPVVATEVCARRGLVVGEVHDENAHAGGGVAGHAGLFAPIDDLARFARAYLAAASGHRTAGLDPSAIRTFATTAAAPGTSWRLGWDTPSSTPGVSHAGDRWPRDHAIGHLGFTGTSLWLDLAHQRWVALLTNRVHPSRDRPEAALIKDLRRDLADLAVRHLVS